jgi:hypothetical protein
MPIITAVLPPPPRPDGPDRNRTPGRLTPGAFPVTVFKI